MPAIRLRDDAFRSAMAAFFLRDDAVAGGDRGDGLRLIATRSPGKACKTRASAGLAAHGVALAHALHRLAPLARRRGLGVVVDGTEVESRAIAGEVAGVRRRVGAFALCDRQAGQECVGGEGGVDVEVAEEDLLTYVYYPVIANQR